ncbi:hypothetical protein CDJ58_03865 [Campylobacter lari]|nr:hypothetical protein [Campylobacter lari]EAK5748536.1 hypothetical protein [Campylobacter lari]EAK9878391.1 hypothetical protein [Campylobacter lari]
MKLSDFDFRIWDNKDNDFLETKLDFLCIAKKDKHKDFERILDVAEDCSGYESSSYFDYTDDRYEIELWTGLYDKFGDKIYEGDIVKYCDFEKLVIKFVDGVFIASRSYNEFIKKIKHGYNEEEVKNTLFKSSYKLYKQVFDEKMCDNLKIIGNIHENKDLLENS